MTDRIKTNDNSELVPKTSFEDIPEASLLRFDFPGLQIGVAEYKEGPTGCTVFYFPQAVDTAIDRRGRSVGAIGNYEKNDAICLAGGSLYGLEASSGVAAELFSRRGFKTHFTDIALVSGAVIYDYTPRPDGNAIYPDKKLGRAAICSAISSASEGASLTFPIGRHGAGCSATVGKGLDVKLREFSGQGGAYRKVGVTRIAVFTVVNAMGAIVNRRGEVVRGNFNTATKLRHNYDIKEIENWLNKKKVSGSSQGNTTLTVVVINQRIKMSALSQFARQVHSSMARAIHPFHTSDDGDILYAVTTNEIDTPDLNETVLGVIASELAWDAVLSIVNIVK